jgi:hypothetical protein
VALKASVTIERDPKQLGSLLLRQRNTSIVEGGGTGTSAEAREDRFGGVDLHEVSSGPSVKGIEGLLELAATIVARCHQREVISIETVCNATKTVAEILHCNVEEQGPEYRPLRDTASHLHAAGMDVHTQPNFSGSATKKAMDDMTEIERSWLQQGFKKSVIDTVERTREIYEHCRCLGVGFGVCSEPHEHIQGASRSTEATLLLSQRDGLCKSTCDDSLKEFGQARCKADGTIVRLNTSSLTWLQQWDDGRRAPRRGVVSSRQDPIEKLEHWLV